MNIGSLVENYVHSQIQFFGASEINLALYWLVNIFERKVKYLKEQSFKKVSYLFSSIAIKFIWYT